MTNHIWILLCAVLVMVQQVGFLNLEAGLTRHKNSVNVAAKNLADACVAFVLFWAVGYAFAYNPASFGYSLELMFYQVNSDGSSLDFLYQSLFCCTTVTIVAGAVAERMTYRAYLLLASFIAALVYPLVVNLVWSEQGWLKGLGFIDYAGGTVVHALAGAIALAAVMIIGPRQGRFDDQGKALQLQSSNLILATQGALILWVGWIGFNGGSAGALNDVAMHAILVTMLGACSGFLAVLAFQVIAMDKFDIQDCLSGLLVGLVAVTAGANILSLTEAVFIAWTASYLTLAFEKVLLRYQIDDAVSAVPVHLVGGVWGSIWVCIAVEGHSGFLVQLMGVGLVVIIGFVFCWVFMKATSPLMPWRVSAEDEELGLNLREHGAKDHFGNLLSAMRENMEDDNLERRLPEEPFTDVGILAKGFNALLDTIGSTKAKLKKEQEQSEASLKNMESLNKTISSHTAISTTDLRGKITFVNDRFCSLCGYSEKKLLHSTHRLLSSGEHGHAFWKNLWDTIQSGERWQGDIRNRKKNGEYYWASVTISPNYHQHQLIGYYCIQTPLGASDLSSFPVANDNDITDRQQISETKTFDLRNKFALQESAENHIMEEKFVDTHPVLAGDITDKQILIVEDTEMNRELIAMLLEDLECHIDYVFDGQQAVNAVQVKRYDLVLMDIQMPVMDGITATKEIRKIFSDDALPIVAMTANAMKTDETSCFKAGMNAFLSKPLDPDKLDDEIMRFLGRNS